jgi:hypothetical protein
VPGWDVAGVVEEAGPGAAAAAHADLEAGPNRGKIVLLP